MERIKASVLHELRGDFVTEEILIDSPKGQEVLVDVKSSGLCHSDLHVRNDGFGTLHEGEQTTALLGHEVAGIVSQIGEAVTEFAVGDHVVASLIQFCGVCTACLSGNTHYCQNRSHTLRGAGESPRLLRLDGVTPVEQIYGIGGFAEKALIHQNQLAKIPKAIDFTKASVLGCGTITGAGAIINTAKIRPGDTVAVIGVGGVGLNAISGARIAGATRIIAIDLQDEKLALAKKFGATDLINSSKEDPVVKVRELTNGGVTAAFEVIGLKSTAEQAIQMAKMGGGAYLIGLQQPNKRIELPPFEAFGAMGRNVKGVWMGSTNIKRDIPMYAELYLQGRMNLDDLIDSEIHIDEVQASYDRLAKGEVIGRIVITHFD